MRLISAGLTHQGRLRSQNQDAFLDAPQQALWVVADGMGGHADGELASRLIVERLASVVATGDVPDFVDSIEDELCAVNAELCRQARERGVGVIGATVVALLGGKDHVLCGWAGDSRAYRFQADRLERISCDHSLAQELLDSGLMREPLAGAGPAGNAVTRAVGSEPGLFVDWALAAYAPGTQFLLCSDGLSKEVPDRRIEQEFRRDRAPAELAETLVQAALAAGGRDNITAIVVRAQAD